MPDTEPNLPATIVNSVGLIPAAFVPASIKALDRLIGAVVDIPVAWLEQQKAKISSKTRSLVSVESSIASAVAQHVGADTDTVIRATESLVRKAYRKQTNLTFVASAMIEDMSEAGDDAAPTTEVDDDWLNVFERYAEDASTDRMQKLWGRVLGGEIRKPGKFSIRTLRFLSEFSQADALEFSIFAQMSFSNFAPKRLVVPDTVDDIRHLLSLEAAGLISGASGLGLTSTVRFNSNGQAVMLEPPVALIFTGEPNAEFVTEIVALTPLGQELVALVPNRNALEAAIKVAEAMRQPTIKTASAGTATGNFVRNPRIIWQDDSAAPPLAL
jgi:Protein of unknown function (DUF2806)